MLLLTTGCAPPPATPPLHRPASPIGIKGPMARNDVAEIRNHPCYAGRANLPSLVTFVEGGSQGNRLILKSDQGSSAPPAGVLRIIGQICQHPHRLNPEGTYDPSCEKNYKGENVTKAKLRFRLEAPSAALEEFAGVRKEFKTFVENLNTIQDADIAAAGSTPLKTQRPIPKDNPASVTVLHPLVIPRYDEDDGYDSLSEYHDANSSISGDDISTIGSDDFALSPFTFEGWPVKDDLWRKELDSFKDTHDIYPMQAFAKDGMLIHPSNYATELPGAIVDLSFTLVHYDFVTGIDRTSNMCIYMTELRVLVPPRLRARRLPKLPRNRIGRISFPRSSDSSSSGSSPSPSPSKFEVKY